MSLLRRLWEARRPLPVVPPPPPIKVRQEPRFTVSQAALERSRRRMALGFVPAGEKLSPWRLPAYAKGVLPNGETKIAMDSWPGSTGGYPYGPGAIQGMWAEGIGFMGYPYLAELTQRPEYRRASEVIAEEMTREWLKVTAKGDGDKQDKVDALEAALKKLNVKEVMRSAAELDGFFGTSFISPNVGTNDDDVELETPLLITPEKIPQGCLKGFKVVDPSWVAPIDYNATDPLNAAFYRPQSWWVMGRKIHASRLLQIISRPMPDLLKPAYNFGGLSMSQMMKPYVDNWLRTRQSVSDLLQAFTVFVLETDMASMLGQNGAATELERAEFFANCKNNLGLMMIDKTEEAFQNVSAPVSGLDHLQAQSQEHMCSVSEIPLVKFTGISPSGLNATSDNEIRVFYDLINARQQRVFSPIISTILEIIQLDMFGEIDPDIGHEWVSLYQLDEAGRASVRKTDADTDAVLIQANVITPDESRDRLRADAESPYAGLEGEAPPPPEEPPGAEGGGPSAPTGDPSEKIANQGAEGGHTGANAADANPFAEAERARTFAYDDASGAWKEDQHPRGPDGKFIKHGVSKQYLATLGGKKATGAGLIKHMIMTGKFSEKDILKVAKEDFGINPTNAAKHYFGQLQEKGFNPPPMPTKSTAPLTEVEKAIEAAKVEEPVSLVSTAIPKPPPNNKDCKYIHALANSKTLPLEAKIEHIENVVDNTEDDLTETYATDVIQALKGGVGAEEAKVEQPEKIVDASKLKKIGGQLGSNPGFQAENDAGKKFYVKASKSDDHAKNEVLAARLYELADAGVVKYHLADLNGALATITDWNSDLKPIDKNNAENKKVVAEDFAVHSWLANWNAVGLNYDNAAIDKSGKPVTMDTGGALLYRAQGEPKGDKFGDVATEWDSLRDPKGNPQAAQIFGDMTAEQLQASAAKVSSISDDDIRQLVMANGPGDDAARKKLADTLIARKADIVKKAAALSGAKTPAEAKPEPKPKAELPKPPPGTNEVYGYVHEAAKNGDVEAVKYYAEGGYSEGLTNYANQVLAHLEGKPPAPAEAKPKGEIPEPPKKDSSAQASLYKWAKEGDQELLKSALNGNYSSHVKEYAQQLLDHLNGKTSAPEVKTPTKHTPASEALEKPLKDNVEKIIDPGNKSKIEDMMKAIHAAKDDVSKLAAVKPIPDANAISTKGANAWLAQLKKDNGLPPDAAAPSPASTTKSSGYAPSTPVQKAVFDKAKGVPPYKSHQIHEMEDAHGNTVEATLKINTKEIADEGFAKVSSAYGDDPSNGATPAVNAAMADYTKEVQKILTSAENDAAHTYKGSGYSAITSHLLGKSKGGAAVEKTIKDLTSAINKAKVPCDTPSWRGVRSSLKDLTGFDDPEQGIGRCFVHKNFGSTSRNVNVSKAFGDKVLLKFTLPAGAPGLPWSGSNVSFSGEEEIMINRNSVFRIDKIEQNPHGGDAKHLVHVTYLGIKQDD